MADIFCTTLLNAAGGGDRDPIPFLGLGRGPPTHRVCRRTILHQIRNPHGRLPAGSYGSVRRCVSQRESHMACWHAPPARADGVTCPHASGDAGLRKARTAMRHVRTPPATLAYAGRVLPWSYAIARGTRQNGRYCAWPPTDRPPPPCSPPWRWPLPGRAPVGGSVDEARAIRARPVGQPPAARPFGLLRARACAG